MRIGVDVRMLENSSGLTGIATSLLETLRELNEIDKLNEYYLFSRNPINCDIEFKRNWHLISRNFPQGMIWYNTVLINFLKQYSIDIFWNANHILPIRKVRGCRYIVTVNDLAIFLLNGIGEYSNILKQRIFVKRSCRIADRVIAISEATKRDLIDLMDVDCNKIYVNYLGGSNSNRLNSYRSNINHVSSNYDIKNAFFLYLGTLEPRKNLITLVKAFELYRENGYGDEDLVIAGGKGWRFEETQKYIDGSRWRTNIHQLGYVSSEEKTALFQNAVAFVFPSLYEGFGIPILEAMEEGVPVITSRISSMPEVGGDSSFYIDDPLDEVDLSFKMNEVVHMTSVEREIVIANGVKWAKHFSWRRTAEGFMNLFQILGN